VQPTSITIAKIRLRISNTGRFFFISTSPIYLGRKPSILEVTKYLRPIENPLLVFYEFNSPFTR